MWVKKSVPAATTRRERVEGKRVGVGEGRRRDMSGKQQPSLAIDGRDGDGNSASGNSSGEHHSSSSAIGANFSIYGPITCSDCQSRLLSLCVQCKGHIYSASYTVLLFAVEIIVEGYCGAS